MNNPEPKMRKSVYKFVFNKSDNVQNYSVKQQIALLFLNNRSKYYKSQDAIIQGLKKIGITRSQSAISKNISLLEHFPFMYHNQIFAICDTPKGYCLLDQADYPKSLRYVLQKKQLLEREFVFFQHGPTSPQMFIFWISNDDEKKELALELFKKCLFGCYQDLFYIDNRLVILLDFKSSRFSNCSSLLQNFFSKDNAMFLDISDD